MNTRREVERHLVEARLHLSILAEYLAGFENYAEYLDIKIALESVNKVRTKYILEDFKAEAKA